MMNANNKIIPEKPGTLSCPLSQIYLYVTKGCNLHCRHCWISPKYQTEDNIYPSLDLGLFREIIEQAKSMGLKTVKLTGGEPLLHPEIREILQFIRKEGIRLVVETNGVLCTTELADKMAACKEPFVSVSLDGVNPETHEWVRGVEGCFEASLRGIKNLVEAGFRPQVIMTIMKQNKDQLETMVRLAEKLGAGSVKFNILQPTSRGKNMHDLGQTLAIEQLIRLGNWVETTLSSSTDLSLYYDHPIAFRPLGKIFNPNGDGCGTCGILSILGVLADGSYALCGIGETMPDLVFGQASMDSLQDVWEKTPILHEIREGLPERLEGVCSYCLVKGLCLGSCIAQNYYSGKNIWAPFWYCREAYNKGLFPETRLNKI